MADLLDTIRQRYERLTDLRREAAEIEAELTEIRKLLTTEAARRGLEVPRAKPKSRHGFTNGKRAKPIKELSSVWYSKAVLEMEQRALPIDELVEKANQISDKPIKRATLVSNLSRYVKHGDTFTRPAPNTFGLVDFEAKPSE